MDITKDLAGRVTHIDSRRVLTFDIWAGSLNGAVDSFILELAGEAEAYLNQVIAAGGYLLDAENGPVVTATDHEVDSESESREIVLPNTIAGRLLADSFLLGNIGLGVQWITLQGQLPEAFFCESPFENRGEDIATILRRIRSFAIEYAVGHQYLWPSDPAVRAAQLGIDNDANTQGLWRASRQNFGRELREWIANAEGWQIDGFCALTGLDSRQALAFAQPHADGIKPPSPDKWE